MTFSIPAHVDFKRRHASFVKWAILASLVAHVLVFLLSPPFSFKPYELEQGREMMVIDPPAELILPKPPPEPPLPDIRVAAPGEEDVADETIPGTSPLDLKDLPMPPPPVSGEAVDFIAFDEPPVLIHFVAPRYPKLARQAGFEGNVMVIVLIDETGDVLDARIGSSDVSAAMEEAALRAARQCRFRPAKQRTKPVKARVAVPFEFRLN